MKRDLNWEEKDRNFYGGFLTENTTTDIVNINSKTQKTYQKSSSKFEENIESTRLKLIPKIVHHN